MKSHNMKFFQKMKSIIISWIVKFRNLIVGMDFKGIGAVLLAFILSRTVIIFIMYLSLALSPVTFEPGDGLWQYNPRNLIADGLIRWDSSFYISIADHSYNLTSDELIPWDRKFFIPFSDHGFTSKSVAFFPLYPLLIRFASMITGNIATSGLYISNLSFLIALFYLYALTKKEYDIGTAARTVFYLAAAPSAFFFSTVYSESTYLMFLTACFYYSRNQKWLLAGLAGALASATRLPGVILAIFIFFESLWQQGVRFFPKAYSLKAHIILLQNDIIKIPRAWKGIFASIFSTSGLIIYMIYLNNKFGDPLLFLHEANAHWGRSSGFNWLPRLIQNVYTLHRWSGNIFSGEIANIRVLFDTLITLAFIPLIIVVLFKFRPSFGLFTLFSFLLPLTSGSTASMQRYLLVLIPCYILLALWGKRPWVERVIIGTSLPLQAYFLVLFSHWMWAG